MPLPRLFVIWQFLTFRFWLPTATAVSATSMPSLLAPLPRKPKMAQFSTCSALPEMNLTPSKPVFAPLIDRLRSVTKMVLGVAVSESLTFTPLVPAASIEPKPWPLVPSMVKFFVIVTVPKPPGSRQSISPLSAVFEMAPANVLQGAVRLHGFTSSPTPDTHVRVACASAVIAAAMQNKKRAQRRKRICLIKFSPVVGFGSGQAPGWRDQSLAGILTLFRRGRNFVRKHAPERSSVQRAGAMLA